MNEKNKQTNKLQPQKRPVTNVYKFHSENFQALKRLIEKVRILCKKKKKRQKQKVSGEC